MQTDDLHKTPTFTKTGMLIGLAGYIILIFIIAIPFIFN